MARETLKALSRKSLTIDELFETLDAVHTMPPQAEVLISYSLLEDALKQAIIRKLPTSLSNTDITTLFDNEGPLASINSRATMAFALGIIGTDTRADLNCIKDIRNSFAHARITLDFANADVANACRDLTAPHRLHGKERFRDKAGGPDWPPKDPRELFRASIKLTWLHITQSGSGGRPVLDTP